VNEQVIPLPRRFPHLTQIDQRSKRRESILEEAEKEIAKLKAEFESLSEKGNA
jgi:hypothetical protein